MILTRNEPCTCLLTPTLIDEATMVVTFQNLLKSHLPMLLSDLVFALSAFSPENAVLDGTDATPGLFSTQ
jgi:hypothetical protein